MEINSSKNHLNEETKYKNKNNHNVNKETSFYKIKINIIKKK